MLPVEGGGLDTDSGSGDSLNGHWSVLRLDPLGGRGSIGKEEEETDTEDHGDSSEDVEDQLNRQLSLERGGRVRKPTFHRATGVSLRGAIPAAIKAPCSISLHSQTKAYRTHDHTSPSDSRVPDSLPEGDLISSVPPTSHEGKSRGNGSFKDTEEESSNHDVREVLGPDHDEDEDTPNES